MGLEVAIRNFKTSFCDVDLYENVHRFESNGEKPDGEFTWNNMKRVDGWVVGASCKNMGNIDNLNIGVEFGKSFAYDKNGNVIGDNSGVEFGLIVSYKLDRKLKKKEA